MDKFEEWFASQDFYINMLFIHGDGLFVKDGDVYRVLLVQMTWEVWQSRQPEVDQLQSQINEMAEVGLSQESVIREKDKRIEELQAKVDAVEHVLGCAMIAPKEVFQYADRIGRALRGEHE